MPTTECTVRLLGGAFPVPGFKHETADQADALFWRLHSGPTTDSRGDKIHPYFDVAVSGAKWAEKAFCREWPDPIGYRDPETEIGYGVSIFGSRENKAKTQDERFELQFIHSKDNRLCRSESRNLDWRLPDSVSLKEISKNYVKYLCKNSWGSDDYKGEEPEYTYPASLAAKSAVTYGAKGSVPILNPSLISDADEEEARARLVDHVKETMNQLELIALPGSIISMSARHGQEEKFAGVGADRKIWSLEPDKLYLMLVFSKLLGGRHLEGTLPGRGFTFPSAKFIIGRMRSTIVLRGEQKNDEGSEGIWLCFGKEDNRLYAHQRYEVTCKMSKSDNFGQSHQFDLRLPLDAKDF